MVFDPGFSYKLGQFSFSSNKNSEKHKLSLSVKKKYVPCRGGGVDARREGR